MIAPADALGVLIDALADRIAARINAGVRDETYDSNNLPPRTARRRFAEVCRSGAVTDARREGQAWVCSRLAWEAARSRKPAILPRAPLSTPTVAAKAEALLARANLRVLKGP